jgi:hypothetical protein
MFGVGIDLRSCKIHYCLAILLLLGVAGCSLPTSGHMPIIVNSETIILEWNPPDLQFPLPPLSISSYRIYYSNHGAQGWSLLGEVAATGNPSYALRHSDFGDGAYDFAVDAVDSRGEGSALHTSLDASANPFGGWYVIWLKSN